MRLTRTSKVVLSSAHLHVQVPHSNMGCGVRAGGRTTLGVRRRSLLMGCLGVSCAGYYRQGPAPQDARQAVRAQHAPPQELRLQPQLRRQGNVRTLCPLPPCFENTLCKSTLDRHRIFRESPQMNCFGLYDPTLWFGVGPTPHVPSGCNTSLTNRTQSSWPPLMK